LDVKSKKDHVTIEIMVTKSKLSRKLREAREDVAHLSDKGFS